MLITATVTVPATHRGEGDVQDLAFGVQYSLEAETQATSVDCGYIDPEDTSYLFISFTWPGYLHQARAALADYRAEGTTDAGDYAVAIEDIFPA